MAEHILIIDDEKNYLLVLEAILSEEGYHVTALPDPEVALTYLEESEVDVVITDMKMPKLTGQDVLEKVKRQYPHIPVLIMTAFGSIEGAVEAMKIGAFDYISKPFSNDELILSVRKAAQFSATQRQNIMLRESLEDRYGLHQIHRQKPRHQTGTGNGGPGRTEQVHGSHHRGIRDRKGTYRQGHPLCVPQKGCALCFGQLHGSEPRRAGKRTVRP